MEQQILPTYIQNERELRFQGHDVSEILIGSDSDIHTTRFGFAAQFRYDVLETCFIRDKGIRPKEPPGFGKSITIRQNSVSENADGSGRGFRFDRGTSRKAHAIASTNPTMLNRYVRFSSMFLILSLGCRLDKRLIPQ